MKYQLQIIDQSPRETALVEIPLADKVAEHLIGSPSGTLQMIESVATTALSHAGVEVHPPVVASIQCLATAEETDVLVDNNRERIHAAVAAGQAERDSAVPLVMLDEALSTTEKRN